MLKCLKKGKSNTRINKAEVHNYCSNKMHFLLKAQDITICTFCLCILSPYMFQPAWAIFRGGQRQCVAKVINDYNSLKLS
jgi:hypothetical protein